MASERFLSMRSCAALLWVLPVTCLAQPDPNWLDHDRARPQPSVVTPGEAGKPPSDAIVLFDGKDLSQWASMDGTPARWISRDSYMECGKCSAYFRTPQRLG